ncbi:hypothetical protein [Streptomyces thermoviolaceus]|uniref:hypothetical protein n=1 Tax=Streptomyces thermoviolaceus TaxID=1952 RepID=UPI0019916D79|nr:hypothetical protein [Streptomyces thermoviolaceus]GGV63748.1 hypothetical protein GCM10010499_06840 [Streptomyces thermoviolaceus subsp. apingens]
MAFQVKRLFPQCSPGAGTGGITAVCLWSVALLVLLPGIVLLPDGTHPSPALALQAVVVAHSGAALVRVLTAPKVRLVALGFWGFAYVWLGLAPLAQLACDTYPWSHRTDRATTLTAVAVVELGLLAHSAGSAVAARRERRRTAGPLPSAPGAVERLLSRRLAPWRLLSLCGLALVLAAVLIPRQPGGLAVWFTSRQALRESGLADGSDGAFLSALRHWSLSVPAFWALLGLLLVPRAPGGDRLLRALRRLLLPLLLALNAVVNNPVSTPRFWIGTVLATLLFAVDRMNRPRAFRAVAAGLLATVLLAFPYSDYFRYSDREQLSVVSLTEQFTTNGDYDAFQQVQTGIDYAHDRGLAPLDVLGPALFWVPRTVWPDKPEDTGIALARFAGYDFQNLSAPLWIESYLWAGPPAVAAVFFLLGAAGRRMDDVRHRLRGRAGTLAVCLVPAFAFYQMVFLRGSLLGIVGPLTLLLAVPLLVSAPAARASRAVTPAPAAPSDRLAPIPHRRAPVTGPNPVPDRYDEPDQLRDQLRRLLCHRAAIALGVALGLLGGAALAFVRTPVYTSASEVLVRSTADPYGTVTVAADNQISMGTEQQIAAGAAVAARAARTLGRPAGDAAALGRHLRVGHRPKSQVLRFEFTDSSPRRAARAADAFAEAYLADRKVRNEAAAQRAARSVEQQIQAVQQDKKQKNAGEAVQRALQTELDTLHRRMVEIKSRDTDGGYVVRHAAVPTRPAGPGRPALLALGGASGLALGILLAWLCSALDTRVRSAGDVRAALRSPVLGLLPAGPGDEPDGGTGPLKVGHRGGDRAESHRALAYRLHRTGPSGGPGGILVVAPRRDAATEEIAVNLAAALTECGRQVLLVDADSDTPPVTARLPLLPDDARPSGQPAPPEGSRLVDAGTAGHFACRTTGDGTVHRLPAAASQERTTVVLARPVLEHADALSAAQRVDGVLLVAGLGTTRREDLRRAAELIDCSGGTLLGAVLDTDRRPDRLRSALAALRSRTVRRPATTPPDTPVVTLPAQDETLTAARR